MKLLSLEFKNFGPYGNSPVIINFSDKNEIIGIIGHNGAGKSTVMFAIYFALFGKSFNGTNKPEMINRINNGDLQAKIEFENKGVHYIIERGLKPTHIKILRNYEEILLDSSLPNIQKYIENHILELNEMLFRQMFMIGMGNFKSFFTLPLASRREIFERIVGLNVFSAMRKKVHLMSKDFKDGLEQNELTESQYQTRIELLQDQIKRTQDFKPFEQEVVDDYSNEILKIEEEEKQLNEKLFDETPLKNEKKTLESKISSIKDAMDKEILASKIKFNDNKKIKKEITFIESHDVCPYCTQSILETFKNEKIQKLNLEIEETDTFIKESALKCNNEKQKIEEIQVKIKSINDKLDQNREIRNAIQRCDTNIKHYKNLIHQHHNNKNKSENYSEEIISNITNEISEIETEVEKVLSERTSIKKNLKINDTMEFVLSDDGFKRYVYSNFLPLLNQFVTENLKFFDFSMNFYLDANLNENFYEKIGENISFSTFSNGEKQIVELAFLFGLQRFLEEIYNFSCNYQFFDELFDTSLDSNKLYYLMNFLRTLNKNIVIISHNPSVNENFDRLYRVTKDSMFSKIEEV